MNDRLQRRLLPRIGTQVAFQIAMMKQAKEPRLKSRPFGPSKQPIAFSIADENKLSIPQAFVKATASQNSSFPK